MDVTHMEELFGKLKIGMEVLIQRSDGRIHAAKVSELHPATKSVCVEWREKNETKGKEIEIELILQLNKSFKYHDRKETKEAKDVSKHKAKSKQSGNDTDESNIIRRRSKYVRSELPLMNKMPDSADDSDTSKCQLRVRSNFVNKKSNCVKEIERIAQKREQRRAQQEQRKQKINEVENSRSWEFQNMIAEYREQLNITRITMDDPVKVSRISVSVRKRPISEKELCKKDIDIITIPNKEICVIHSPKEKVDLTKYLDNQRFRFDYAFDETSDNELVYHFASKQLVNAVFSGAHAMCFAYGQTGSGKTYTMGGDFVQKKIDCSNGIYALTTKDIFKQADGRYFGEFSVFCSFFEIYCGKVFDLFNNKKRLRVLEDHNNVVQIVNLKEEHVSSVEEIMDLIQYGMGIRTSGTTSANDNSSRSHAVFQIVLKSNQTGRDHGKISLIDLAGSERGRDTNSSDRTTLLEGAEINKSLLALKECIRALGRKAEHVPFRGSTLTKVLRDSFIGENSMVSMIAMISPSASNCEHTLNTLRYADRVKELNADDEACEKEACNGLERNSFDEFADDEELYPADEQVRTFQRYISEIADMEEQVNEKHCDLIAQQTHFISKLQNLFDTTCEIEYDRVRYVSEFDRLLTTQMSILSEMHDMLTSFRDSLKKEEQLNQTMQFSVRQKGKN